MSFYSTAEVTESTGVKVFKSGISKVKFNGAKFESAKKDGSGNNVLSFHFIDDDGGEMNIKHWEITPQNSKGLIGKKHLSNRTIKLNNKEYIFVKDTTITENDALILAYNNFNIFSKHILNRFDETLNVAGNSYKEYSENAIKLLKPFIGTEVKIATEYKGKYLEIKRNVPFLANISDNTTLEKLTLKIIKDEVKPDEENDAFTSDKSDTNFDVF